MTKALSIMAVLVVAASAQARKVSDYIVHQSVTGSSATQGHWNNDYIQLIPCI